MKNSTRFGGQRGSEGGKVPRAMKLRTRRFRGRRVFCRVTKLDGPEKSRHRGHHSIIMAFRICCPDYSRLNRSRKSQKEFFVPSTP